MQGSGNVDDSGNFSITVLREALRRMADVELSAENKDVESALRDPEQFEAYLLNLESHWFTLRRLDCAGAGQKWFNLNSTLSDPEVISPFFLSAFLAQMREEGYSIFVVRVVDHASALSPRAGAAAATVASPASSSSSSSRTSAGAGAAATAVGRGMSQFRLPAPMIGHTAPDARDAWHSVASVLARGAAGGAAAVRRNAQQQALASATDDPDFHMALQASLADSGGAGSAASRGGSGGVQMSEEEQLRLALAASLAEHTSPTSAASSSSAGRGASIPAQQPNAGRLVAGGSIINPGRSSSIASSSAAAAGDGGHSWGSGSSLAAGSSHAAVAAAASPASAPAPGQLIDLSQEMDDEDLQAALKMSLDMPSPAAGSPMDATSAAAAGAETETPAAAVARLRSRLPPEPPVTTAVPSARIQIRLQASTSPHTLLTGPPNKALLSQHRRFLASESMSTIFDFAELCWLEAWLGAADAASPAPAAVAASAIGNGASDVVAAVGAVSASASSSSAAASADGSATAGLQVMQLSPYALLLTMPPKSLTRAEYMATTLEGAGLMPSASLALKPV